MRESKDLNRQPWMRRSLKINGTYGSEIKVQSLGLTGEVAELVVATATDTMDKVAPINFVAENGLRQRIPSQKQMVDPNRQGLIVEGGVGYKQTVVIRSYEVGPDKTATLEAIFNLFQVTRTFFFLIYDKSFIIFTLNILFSKHYIIYDVNNVRNK